MLLSWQNHSGQWSVVERCPDFFSLSLLTIVLKSLQLWLGGKYSKLYFSFRAGWINEYIIVIHSLHMLIRHRGLNYFNQIFEKLGPQLILNIVAFLCALIKQSSDVVWQIPNYNSILMSVASPKILLHFQEVFRSIFSHEP